MNLSMMASSWSMSSAMLRLASSSCTLISASSRSRASGVRRSCEMPASITARSSSTLANSRAMRLKPMLTWRISLVSVFSSSCDSYSPSRMRLAANDRSRKGWLISRAMPAEPSTVASKAMVTHSSQVLPAIGLTRVGSACSQYWSLSIVKPTHSPLTPLTVCATSVSGPRRVRSSSLMAREKRSVSNGRQLSLGSRGNTFTSWSFMDLTSVKRLMPSVYCKAARDRFTRLAICLADCTARGSNSSARKVWTQANTPPTNRMASRKNVRQNRLNATVPSGKAGGDPSGTVAAKGFLFPETFLRSRLRLSSAIWDEDITHAPHRLDVARLGWIGFDHFAQTRDLHVEAAVERLELAAARQLRELVARQRLARVTHQCLQHRKLAGGQRDLFAILGQAAQRQVEFERAESDDHRVLGRCARRLHGGPASQHGMDAGQQFARIERLGQVVVGTDFQADDAVHVFDLGGQHDDGRGVAGGAQAAADRQAVFAGQHQVQHDQVDRFTGQDTVQRLGVFRQQDFKTFL